jgi:SAM-dependent methyltransferase
MNDRPKTWHYGIHAQYWAEFHLEGPEIAYYQKLIEGYGQPALDAGCGTGRLLLPFLRAGLDVDGSDISPDMLALCREKAAREGLTPGLYTQAMHELDLPRTYRTIVACGSFGIASTRQQDALALRRFYRHLAPGGVLLLDHHMPYGDQEAWQWELWLKENREKLSPDWWPEREFERASDGSDYAIRVRVADLNPLDQVLTLQMRAERWRDGRLLEEEEYTLTTNIYFKNEFLMMLEQAGFKEVAVHGDYTNAAATAEHGVLVFIAKRET